VAPSKVQKSVEENRNLATMSVTEAGNVLEGLFKLPPAKAPAAVMVGNTGIGKTTVGKNAWRKVHPEGSLIVRHLSQVHPLDLGGVGIDPATRTMYFAKPPLVEEVMALPAPRLLFLDEIDRIQPIAQSAMLQLLSPERTLNGFKLEDTYVIGAANAWYCQYTFELDRAFASRLVMMHCITNNDRWLQWAADHRIHPSVLVTVACAADVLNQHTALGDGAIKVADERAWEALSHALNAGCDPSVAELFVGQHAGKVFKRYVNFSNDYRQQIAAVKAGKQLPADTELPVMMGVYMAVASQMENGTDLDKVYGFLVNSDEQLGAEKSYVVGRLLTYKIPTTTLLEHKKIHALHKKLFEVFSGENEDTPQKG